MEQIWIIYDKMWYFEEKNHGQVRSLNLQVIF